MPNLPASPQRFEAEAKAQMNQPRRKRDIRTEGALATKQWKEIALVLGILVIALGAILLLHFH